jgi:hypothetical protein
VLARCVIPLTGNERCAIIHLKLLGCQRRVRDYTVALPANTNRLSTHMGSSVVSILSQIGRTTSPVPLHPNLNRFPANAINIARLRGAPCAARTVGGSSGHLGAVRPAWDPCQGHRNGSSEETLVVKLDSSVVRRSHM